VGVLFVMRRSGLTIRPRLFPIEPDVRERMRAMVPMVVGLGLLQFNELLERAIAWVLTATAAHPTLQIFGWEVAKPLNPGVLVRIDAARYLYQFPMGVLANSLAVAIFPLLSLYSARGDMPNLRGSLNRALRLSFMEGLAAGVGLFLLAEPITSLLYQHGRFTAEDSRHAAFILQMYVLGMWAYCSYQIFSRAFYALKENYTPLKVSCSLVVLELAMLVGLLWVPQVGAAAFGLTTATIFSLNSLILAIKLRKRLGRFGGRKLAVSIGRSLLACGAMAAAILALQWAIRERANWVHVPAWIPEGLARATATGVVQWLLRINVNWIIVGVCVPAGAAVFLLTARLLRAPELGELFARKRKPDADPVRST
jgi:putative peptidoglycan lipid II flippase